MVLGASFGENIELLKVFIHGVKDIQVPIQLSINASKLSPNSKLIVIKYGVYCFNRYGDKTINSIAIK